MKLSTVIGCLMIVATAQAADAISNDQQALLQAARSGNTAQVKELLNKGVDPNTQDQFGARPLALALQRPIVLELDPSSQAYKDAITTAQDIAQELLSRGARPDEKDFLAAIKLGLVDLVKTMQPEGEWH